VLFEFIQNLNPLLLISEIAYEPAVLTVIPLSEIGDKESKSRSNGQN